MIEPVTAEVTIVNSKGLHARAAALFAKTAAGFDADISVFKADLEVDGTSIMDLMMLVAGPGTTLKIVGCGPQAAEAVDALCDLVRQRFHEPD